MIFMGVHGYICDIVVVSSIVTFILLVLVYYLRPASLDSSLVPPIIIKALLQIPKHPEAINVEYNFLVAEQIRYNHHGYSEGNPRLYSNVI